jgi:ADP-ribose pyrophosphatase
MKPERLISSKIVFECPIFKVEEATVKLKDGSKAKRWYILKNDAVVVICIRNKKIIMLREFRSASGTVVWRLPAGGVEDNEDPKDAAIRETREEIGLEPLDIKLLSKIPNPSGSVKQNFICYKATKFRENPLPGEKDYIKVKDMTFAQVKNLLDKHEITSEYISRFLMMVVK